MASDTQLKQAIVESVEKGVYPDPDVSSAELPSSLLPALLQDLQRARDEVKADIRRLSKDVAPDVDGWIAQAKKLQADIERSKATARDIVSQAEAGKALKEKANDASNKTRLLEKEVAFNESLTATLGHIRSACRILDTAEIALNNNDLRAALDAVRESDDTTKALTPVHDTRAVGLLQTRSSRIKATLLDKTTTLAHSLIDCNTSARTLKINTQVPDTPNVDIHVVVEILTYLEAYDSYIRRLKRDLEDSLLEPRLSNHNNSAVAIQVNDKSIQASESSPNPDTLSALDDIWVILDFLSAHLPESVCSPLSQKLLPSLFDRLTLSWLDACIPVQIEQMPAFQRILDRVTRLAQQIDALHWSTTSPLKEWVQHAPRTWLSKRREIALGEARSLLFLGLRERRTVERVETQTVSKGDVIMGGTDDADDAWDEEWDENASNAESLPSAQKAATVPEDDDEDASAWGLDDDNEVEEEKAAAPSSTPENGEDEDAEAWGWGDDEQAAEEVSKPPPDKKAPQAKNDTSTQGPSERELTLRETYTVTAVPDGILDIIAKVVSDAETLTDPSYSASPIGPAASALYTLPTFVLAIYRATSFTAYGSLPTGNMLIYNDASRLADSLRTFLLTQAQKDSTSSLPPNLHPSSRLRLDNDIRALESFAKKAYSSEMESQRTILRDMLDGAQGFSNSTVEPFASACSSAVSITAERIRDVHTQWKPILSSSALLQSTGSLLGTTLSKIILEIEDLSDIGEEESKALRSYCDTISSVRDLFLQPHPESGEAGDMTGIYCPNWFKFQYLGELLESSLADIKYLWIEGELRLEFDEEEVTDLIQALFADSDYRRKAIADIRRS